MDLSQEFSTLLLDWHPTIERYLPWKEDDNVFYIWLSEIILQQTRVQQGIPYFLKFKERFRNVTELAEVSDEELMKLWEGLGYYSRARNLHQAAKHIVENGGQFPNTYEGLLNLKGVGPYTAAAIASFAYNIPVPVIDGNVNRVISRIFGITQAIDSKEGKLEIKKTIDRVFDKDNPALFNQAIMDFGALICTPKNPSCEDCSFADQCFALNNEMIAEIPWKVKKIRKTDRVLHYLLVEHGQSILIRKRTEKGIWRHLHEFVLMEGDHFKAEERKANLIEITESKSIQYQNSCGPYKHVLTHQNLKIYFHHYLMEDLKIKNGGPYFLVERENLRKFAFPKIIDWYLDENSIYLKENSLK